MAHHRIVGKVLKVKVTQGRIPVGAAAKQFLPKLMIPLLSMQEDDVDLDEEELLLPLNLL